MAIVIKPKTSNSASAVPTTGNLTDGEFATNTADKKIFQRVGGSIVTIADQTENAINGASSKTTPADNDRFGILDSAASYILKYISWANLKAAIKSYYDSVISVVTNKDLTSATNTFATLTSVSNNATLTPTIGSWRNILQATAQTSNATIAAPSGTGGNFNMLLIRITTAGAITLTWNAAYKAIGITLPTSIASGKTFYAVGHYNTANSKVEITDTRTES